MSARRSFSPGFIWIPLRRVCEVPSPAPPDRSATPCLRDLDISVPAQQFGSALGRPRTGPRLSRRWKRSGRCWKAVANPICQSCDQLAGEGTAGAGCALAEDRSKTVSSSDATYGAARSRTLALSSARRSAVRSCHPTAGVSFHARVRAFQQAGGQAPHAPRSLDGGSALVSSVRVRRTRSTTYDRTVLVGSAGSRL